jgi:CopG antitoxin of type II toxin-antitoxin system
MTLAIDLPDDIYHRLEREATATGLSPAELAAQIVHEAISARSESQDAVALLQSWIDQGDAEEQRATYDYLTRVLDEDRPAERKLFPPELKGVTW